MVLVHIFNSNGKKSYGPVATDGCPTMNHFCDRIKWQFQKKLGIKDSTQLFLYEKVLVNGRVRHVKVPNHKPVSSLIGPLQVRVMHKKEPTFSALISTRNCLSNITREIDTLYELFKMDDVPTRFDDVLLNKDDDEGIPIPPHTKPLDEMFTKHEWRCLRKMNKAVNDHLELIGGTKWSPIFVFFPPNSAKR
jgi:hypothetical protein